MNVLADAASMASTSDSVASDSAASDASNRVLPKQSSLLVKKKRPKLQHILMKLLNEETDQSAIWWLPGEKEFAINAEKFPDVLSAYLPGTKYASFIRRLHKLGFTRQTRSLKKVYGTLPEHAVAFRHEKFRRDRPELMEELKNSYWKEAKARKAREEAASPPSSPSPPPAVVIAPASMSVIPSPIDPEMKKPAAPAARTQGVEGAEAQSQQSNDREAQLILLRQRVAQEQQEIEELLALRQQQRELAFLRQQQQQQALLGLPYSGIAQDSSPDLLLRLQLLRGKQSGQHNPFNDINDSL